MPPPPGQSNELPPGYLTGDAKEKRQRSDRRKRMFTIVGGVVVLLVAILATVALTAQGSEDQTVADLDVGECFNGEVNDLEVVDCAEAHAGELFAVAPAADASIPYPGAEQARLDGGNVCAVELGTYYGADTATATANGVELNPVAPTEEQWDAGETDTYCLAVPADGGVDAGLDQGPGRRRLIRAGRAGLPGAPAPRAGPRRSTVSRRRPRRPRRRRGRRA